MKTLWSMVVRVRQESLARVAITAAGILFACAEGGGLDAPGSGVTGSGGSGTGGIGAGSNNGGSTAIGQGGTSSGGSSSSVGGANAGATSKGGTTSTAGASTSGGAATAGSTGKATGGTSSSGGASATGGKASGGATATGGATEGGSTSAAGATSTGGTTSAAGSPATGGASTAGNAATGGSTAVSNGLRLEQQGCSGTCAPTGNVVWLYFRLVNTGSSSVSLSSIKIRYFYTDTKLDVLETDYVSISAATVTGAFVALPTPTATADHYVELSFAGGTLAAGGTLVVSSRAHNVSYAALDQTNDYSYAGSSTYAANDKVAVYEGTTLIWGTEP